MIGGYPALEDVPRLTLLSSLKCARLKLWDEERNKLVSFRDVRRSDREVPRAA